MLDDRYRNGFTLLELVTVTAIVLVLALLVSPALMRARDAAFAGACASNLKQLVTANMTYAAEHGSFAPAAENFSANLLRWHGARDGTSQPFDGTRGALSPYLGSDDRVRACPSFDQAAARKSPSAFEASCGGYGYNMVGVGSTAYLQGFAMSNTVRGMPPSAIADPARTVMFADTAFGQPYDNPDHLIEYSFAEPYHFVNARGEEYGQTQPSLHFRHADKVSIAWCDGHVTLEENLLSDGNISIGWLGETADNSLFDPF